MSNTDRNTVDLFADLRERGIANRHDAMLLQLDDRLKALEITTTDKKAEPFRITGPGKYRTRGGKPCIITADCGWGTHCWDGVVDGETNCWATSGKFQEGDPKDHPIDIVERLDEPAEEMAGLKGLFIVEIDASGMWHCEDQLQAERLAMAGRVVIDLSKIPASAIVRPEPKIETVVCRFWAFKSGVIICRRKDEESWPGHGEKPISHWEQDITFTHGEGLEGGK